MATAAVAPLQQIHDPQDASALARKRRREILLSQRASVVPDTTVSQELSTNKRRRVSEPEITPIVTKSSVSNNGNNNKKKGTKKPQMKYDPDVPMTKEEAAVWRREQRRKRNRESAAASRQRQRDRISELEVELDDWKQKFAQVMKKIEDMEEIARMKVTDELIDSLPTSVLGIAPKIRIVDTPSPVVSRSYIDAGKVTSDEESEATEESSQDEEHHTNKMISRQAVKITGDAPLFQDESMMLPVSMCPDPCVSSNANVEETTPTPELKQESIPSLLTDAEEETDLGAFLLDAVQWL